MPESIIQPFIYRATAYALVAALAEALTWYLFSLDVQGLAGSVLVAAIVGGPVLSGLSLRWPGLVSYASTSLVISSISVTLLTFSTVDFAQPETAGAASGIIRALSSLHFWPLIVTGLLAGGALDALATSSEVLKVVRGAGMAHATRQGSVREQFVRSSGALLNLSFALTLAILSVVFYGVTVSGTATNVAWLVGTPIHLAILVLFAAICCLLISVWLDVAGQRRLMADPVYPPEMVAARSQIQRRFLRTLIALLPVMGFLGTVWGIKIALSHIPRELFFQDQSGDISKAIADMTTSLKGIATAFETTLLGLLGSIAATLALSQIERSEAYREAREMLDREA